MANQSSIVIVSSTQEDISNWEFVNSEDYHDDHDVVVVSDDDTFIFDISSSSSDHDDVLEVDDDVFDVHRHDDTLIHDDDDEDAGVHDDDYDVGYVAKHQKYDGHYGYGNDGVGHVCKDEEDRLSNDDEDVGTHQNESSITHVVHVHDDDDDEGYVAENQKHDGHYDYGHGYVNDGVGHVCKDEKDGLTNDGEDVGTHQNEASLTHVVHVHDDDEGHVDKHQKHDDHYDYGHGYVYGNDGVGRVFEDEEEVDDGYGMDDLLVPWELKGVFGKQRMRKLGKKGVVNKTKKRVNSKKKFTKKKLQDS